jgi:hypothetical protein
LFRFPCSPVSFGLTLFLKNSGVIFARQLTSRCTGKTIPHNSCFRPRTLWQSDIPSCRRVGARKRLRGSFTACQFVDCARWFRMPVRGHRP